MILWAGKHLSGDEEQRLRDLIEVFGQAGCSEDVEWYGRFLPENAHTWTPDELEFGAHHGPWLSFSAAVDAG